MVKTIFDRSKEGRHVICRWWRVRGNFGGDAKEEAGGGREGGMQGSAEARGCAGEIYRRGWEVHTCPLDAERKVVRQKEPISPMTRWRKFATG